jgi:hypothetical protein
MHTHITLQIHFSILFVFQAQIIGICVGSIVGGLLVLGGCAYFFMSSRKTADTNELIPPNRDRIPPPTQSVNTPNGPYDGYSSY